MILKPNLYSFSIVVCTTLNCKIRKSNCNILAENMFYSILAKNAGSQFWQKHDFVSWAELGFNIFNRLLFYFSYYYINIFNKDN